VSRSCYEFALVLSNLHDVEAQARGRGGGAHADQDIDGLWRKRVEAAEDIVNAAAPTIQGVILKVAMTRFLLSESALLVGLTAQCLEECDRALSQDDGCEQNLEEQEPELWRLCKDVQEKIAELEEAVRDPHFVSRGLFAHAISGPSGATIPALPVPVAVTFRDHETTVKSPPLLATS